MIKLEVLFQLFFMAIVLDFVTGVLVAAKNGKLRSRTCSDGLFRTLGECIVLVILIIVAWEVPGVEGICITFILAFVFKEGLSIIENLTLLGVWIPQKIKTALEVNVEKVDKKEE